MGALHVRWRNLFAVSNQFYSGYKVHDVSMGTKQTEDKQSDALLLSKIAGNDREAFTLLASRYEKAFFAIAYRMGLSVADSEEAVQESFIRIWRKASSWKPHKNTLPRSWLYKITSNVCLDFLRKARRQVEYYTQNYEETMQVQASNEKEADRIIEEKQRQILIRSCVCALPERQRMALILCHYQELSNAEAAYSLGIGIKALESLLVRARKNLKSKLQSHEGIL